MKGSLPLRQPDAFGEGHYGASRGDRIHNGIDLACYPGTTLESPVSGTVTKLGYPYGDDLSFRYVQVTDEDGFDHRFFYVKPKIDIGFPVFANSTELGESQDLTERYPEITNHIHYEIKKDGEYIDPGER